MHRAFAAVVAAIILLGVSAPRSVLAADDIKTSSTSVYQVQPDKGRIRVTVTSKVTNAIPSTTSSYDCSYQYYDYYFGFITIPRTCSTTTRYYVNQTSLWVESAAKDLKVTSNGGSVKLKSASKIEGYRSYDVTFPKIFKGQTRTITATYTIPGGAPRSATSHRVNGAYVNFSATSQATDTAKVTVKIPKGFEVESFGGKMSSKTVGTEKVLQSGSIDDPTSFYVAVTGTDPAGFVKDQVKTREGRTVQILGWPGDPAWMDAVRGEAATALPALERIIGQPLPGHGDITIRETAGSIFGDAYIASYDPVEQIARVSENFDQAGTVTHELSHAWFNDTLFGSRWLSEGYASWIERGTGTVAEPCVAPSAYPGAGKPSLASWQVAGPRATAQELGAVSFQYDAACALVSQAADRIGVDGMRAVIGVLATAESAYAGIDDLRPGTPVGWRDWLDAIDERGLAPMGRADATDVASLLVDYGVATSADLRQRSEARAAFRALRDATVDWDVPPAVNRPMAYWDFAGATTAISTAADTFHAVAEVESLLPEVQADSSPIRRLYLDASDLAELRRAYEQATDQLDAAEVVAQAVAAAGAEPGPIEQIGLLGADVRAISASAVAAVEAVALADARLQAQQVQDILGDAMTNGLIRIALVMVVVIVAVAIAWTIRRRRRVVPHQVVAALEADTDEEPTMVAPAQPVVDGRPGTAEPYVSAMASIPDDPVDRL